MQLLRVAAISVVLAILALALASAPSGAQTSATVVVSATDSLGVIPPMAFGMNTTSTDAILMDPGVPDLLKSAGATALRYPGGSYSDLYHWRTNTCTGGRHCYPQDNFDSFMTSIAKPIGASVIITANYGTNEAGNAGGDPSEAAAWVAYANKTKGYGVKYWEIGNELYGNGEYGPHWERDLHADHSPLTYGANVVAYANAMKAEDPTIKIGADLALPDEPLNKQDPKWDENVLAQCGKSIDFVIQHWYPQNTGYENDAVLLASSSEIPAIVAGTRALIDKYCGANAPNVQILVTETNSVNSRPGRQIVSLVDGLFMPDDYMTWLENGVANVDWFDLHDGAEPGGYVAGIYGTEFYGDYGMLAYGGSSEPAAETPFPPFRAMQMMTHLGTPGDSMVKAESSSPLVGVHAVKKENGRLALLLINKDPTHTCATTVSVNGYKPGALSTIYCYGEGSAEVTQAAHKTGSRFTIALPPYSLTTIDMAETSIKTPAFVALASASPSWTVAGKKVRVTAHVTNTGVSCKDAALEVELRDGSGKSVCTKTVPDLSFAEDASLTLTADWNAPANPGSYSVAVQVYSQSSRKMIYSDPNAAALVVNPRDTAQYNFENGTQGWASSGGMIAGVTGSNAQAFGGATSLAVNFRGDAADVQDVHIDSPRVSPGDTVTFEVWIPADTVLKTVQPYANGSFGMVGDSVRLSRLRGNAWNTLAVAIPSDAKGPVSQLGVRFSTSGAWTGTCYLDSVKW